MRVKRTLLTALPLVAFAALPNTAATARTAESAAPGGEADLIQQAAESFFYELFDVDGAPMPIDIACAVSHDDTSGQTGGVCYTTIFRLGTVVIAHVIHDGGQVTAQFVAEYSSAGQGLFADYYDPSYVRTYSTDQMPPAPDPEPFIPLGIVLEGVDTAQRVATATAVEDWDTYRAIRPDPPYTDAELTEGYAGLEAIWVELVSYAPSNDGDAIDLYLGLIAHETKPHGQQTALHCVIWRYQLDNGTITGSSGRAELRVIDGFILPDLLIPDAHDECAA